MSGRDALARGAVALALGVGAAWLVTPRAPAQDADTHAEPPGEGVEVVGA